MLFTSIAIVAAFVLDKLLRDLQADEILARKVRGVGARVLAGVIGLVVVVALGYSVPGLFNADDISRNLGILKAFFLVWAAISVLGMYAGKRIDIKWAVVGVIALELFDLLPYSFHYKLSVPRGRTCFETPGIRFLEDRMETEGPFRIFRDRNTVLPPNSPMIFHLDEIGGYESSISAGYTGFFSAIDATMSRNPRTLDLPHNYDTYTQPFWSFLGVRYLIAASPMPRLPQPWGLVYQDDLCIYENPDWLPRWFLVPAIMRAESIDEGYRLSRTIDPRAIAVAVGVDPADLPPGLRNIMAPVSNISGDAPVQSCDGVLQTEYYGPDELRLNSNCDRDSFLVFSDACFPGWRAWLDGKEVKVYRTDGIVKGIVLPSGSHKVRFLFDPVSGKIGWLLVLVGAILTPIMMRPTQRLLSISKQ
jgi:hypothetical protein